LVTSVSSLASSNAPGSALPLARAAVDRAVAATAGYGERPAFRADSVAATQASNAMSQRLNHLTQARALQRADGLLGVTLAVTQALEETLVEMQYLSVTLQDDSLSHDEHVHAANTFDTLSRRSAELLGNASFAGRNLIDPEADAQTGDVALPSGKVIAAHDLRPGMGTVLTIDPPIKAPHLDRLLAAFAYEGNISPVSLGTPPLASNAFTGYPNQYLSGEDGGLATRAWHYRIGFQDTDAITIGLSARPVSAGTVFRYEHGADAVSLTISGGSYRLNQNGTSVAVGAATTNEWSRINLAIDESGAGSLYMNGNAVAHFSFANPMTDSTTNNRLLFIQQFNGPVFDNLTIYSDDLSGSEIREVDRLAQRGVQNWSAVTTSQWSQVSEDLSTSLTNLRRVQAYYGGAARSLDRDMALQQRMSDILDAGVSRLVNRDIERSSILLAAAEVRVQLAQAMMDTQRSIMSEATTLFANAADVFDRINASGFRPSGLKL
jgi:flagellin-like hook-associated protein FlgL